MKIMILVNKDFEYAGYRAGIEKLMMLNKIPDLKMVSRDWSIGPCKKRPSCIYKLGNHIVREFCISYLFDAGENTSNSQKKLDLVSKLIKDENPDCIISVMLGRHLVKREFDNDQVYVIPVDVTNWPQTADVLYLQALFALKQKNISLAICEHYGNMVEMLRYIEKHWPALADDIERGNPHIEPDPERANAIREIMEGHQIGSQLVPQLWPGLRCIMVYDVDRLNASFELLRTYCGSNVHFVFMGISTPEGTFSTTLNLDDPQTVLIPDSVFYEFKPKEANSYLTLLTMDQLEIGRSYELVVTTLSGLYRYKTGKTITVVGRYHDTPTVIIDKE